jgi:hypothetical protein
VTETLPLGTVAIEPTFNGNGECEIWLEPHPEGRRKAARLMSWTWTLYQTKRDYYAAVAHEWLSAVALNDRQFVRRTFAETSDDELADEVIEVGASPARSPPSNATA